MGRAVPPHWSNQRGSQTDSVSQRGWTDILLLCSELTNRTRRNNIEGFSCLDQALVVSVIQARSCCPCSRCALGLKFRWGAGSASVVTTNLTIQSALLQHICIHLEGFCVVRASKQCIWQQSGATVSRCQDTTTKSPASGRVYRRVNLLYRKKRAIVVRHFVEITVTVYRPA